MVFNRRILTIFILTIFVMAALISFAPGYLFAQEESEQGQVPLPEELSVDVSYNEVINYGIIGASFDFTVELLYKGEEGKYFEFDIGLPDGWDYVIKPEFGEKNIDKVKLEPDKPETLKFTVRPLVPKEVGEYEVVFTVFSSEEDDELRESVELLAIVKSAGDLKFGSKTGRFNTEINKTGDNKIVLLLENIGTGPVEEIELSVVDQPENWLIEYEKNIKIIEVDEVVEIEANILPDDRTIAGDYNVRFLAQSDESSDFVDIRTTVKVPMIWQIVGIAIIVIVVAGIAVLFERLGRR